ncbi:MAG: hypothetical protein FWG71_09490 [Synergistaceae bacterium]|nr:hypothetical protein [Synergistaceae bacterium]
MEKMEGLPYYPYSAMGIGAVVLLLLAVMIGGRKRPSSQKNNPNRPRVVGVAVGMSSHEEFSGGYAYDDYSYMGGPIGSAATPSMAVPPIPAVPPLIAAPPIMTSQPAAPAAAAAPPSPPPPPPAVVPELSIPMNPAHEQTFKLCNGKFQGLYMEMYIEMGLVSNFDRLRTEISHRFKSAETHRAVSEEGMTPEGVVLMQMANVAGDFLQSGERHTGRGQLDIHGQELLKVYRYALNTMREKNFATQAETQSKLDFMEKKVQELGN